MTDARTVLITGGFGGLGSALTKKFLAEGYAVFAADLRVPEHTLSGVTAMQTDITKPDDRQRLWDMIFSHGATIDILVNNAAITRAHDYTSDFTLGADHARAEIEINFAAPVEMSRLYLAHRRKAGREAMPGMIVNIGAGGGLIPLESIPLYSATKAGLHMFTLTLRRQLRTTAVKVAEVFPPSMDTPLATQLQVGDQAGNGPEVIEQVAGEIMAGILAGDEVILPHEQSRMMMKYVPQLDERFVNNVNKGVLRKADWQHG